MQTLIFGASQRGARFVQTHYLPSDGIIWKISFLLKYKISPESLFKLQREIWGKEILPIFIRLSLFQGCFGGGVGRKQNCFLVSSPNLIPCCQSIPGHAAWAQLCSSLGLRSQEKELEPLVQHWATVIGRVQKRQSLLWSPLSTDAPFSVWSEMPHSLGDLRVTSSSRGCLRLALRREFPCR